MLGCLVFIAVVVLNVFVITYKVQKRRHDQSSLNTYATDVSTISYGDDDSSSISRPMEIAEDSSLDMHMNRSISLDHRGTYPREHRHSYPREHRSSFHGDRRRSAINLREPDEEISAVPVQPPPYTPRDVFRLHNHENFAYIPESGAGQLSEASHSLFLPPDEPPPPYDSAMKDALVLSSAGPYPGSHLLQSSV